MVVMTMLVVALAAAICRGADGALLPCFLSDTTVAVAGGTPSSVDSIASSCTMMQFSNVTFQGPGYINVSIKSILADNPQAAQMYAFFSSCTFTGGIGLIFDGDTVPNTQSTTQVIIQLAQLTFNGGGILFQGALPKVANIHIQMGSFMATSLSGARPPTFALIAPQQATNYASYGKLLMFASFELQENSSLVVQMSSFISSDQLTLPIYATQSVTLDTGASIYFLSASASSSIQPAFAASGCRFSLSGGAQWIFSNTFLTSAQSSGILFQGTSISLQSLSTWIVSGSVISGGGVGHGLFLTSSTIMIGGQSSWSFQQSNLTGGSQGSCLRLLNSTLSLSQRSSWALVSAQLSGGTYGLDIERTSVMATDNSKVVLQRVNMTTTCHALRLNYAALSFQRYSELLVATGSILVATPLSSVAQCSGWQVDGTSMTFAVDSMLLLVSVVITNPSGSGMSWSTSVLSISSTSVWLMSGNSFLAPSPIVFSSGAQVACSTSSWIAWIGNAMNGVAACIATAASSSIVVDRTSTMSLIGGVCNTPNGYYWDGANVTLVGAGAAAYQRCNRLNGTVIESSGSGIPDIFSSPQADCIVCNIIVDCFMPLTNANAQCTLQGGVASCSLCTGGTGSLCLPDMSGSTTAQPIITTVAPSTAAFLPTTAVPITTTIAPATTTAIPATAVPATAVPVTAVPATAVPVTAAPVTDIPATAVPATAVPATAVPATAVPVTAAPVTDIPATTAVPVTVVPVTDIPATAVPVTDIPATTAAPVTAVPATAVPVTAAPVTDIPATAVPVTAVPATAVPVTVVPVTDIPATAVPVTDIPATTAAPVTAVPVTVVPVTAAPVTDIPATAVPATAVPATAVPATTTAMPATVAPDTTSDPSTMADETTADAGSTTSDPLTSAAPVGSSIITTTSSPTDVSFAPQVLSRSPPTMAPAMNATTSVATTSIPASNDTEVPTAMGSATPTAPNGTDATTWQPLPTSGNATGEQATTAAPQTVSPVGLPTTLAPVTLTPTTSAPTVLEIVVSGNTTFEVLAQALANKTGVPVSSISLVHSSTSDPSSATAANATMVVSFGLSHINSTTAITAAQTLPFVLAASPEPVSTPSPTTTPDATTSSFPIGAVVGGVIGGLILIAITVVLIRSRMSPVTGGKRFDDDCVMMNEKCLGTLDELLNQEAFSQPSARV